MTASVLMAQGCRSANSGRPPVPNSATQTADAMSFGRRAQPPDCSVEPIRTADGSYPGPGFKGIVSGFVAAGLDSSCQWRQRSMAVEGSSVELYAAGADGEHGGSDDQLVARTTTGPAGCYEIHDVETPGSYVVRIAGPDVAVCDSDSYEYTEAGVARAELHPIAAVVTANFGIAR